jgi:hypothetical protein
MLCFLMVLRCVDWWLEVLCCGSATSVLLSVCTIVHLSVASLAELGVGRAAIALRGWRHEAWGAEGARVFFLGASLFSWEGVSVLPLPFSILDLLLTSLEIGQQCHFSALRVANLCLHNLHC